MKLEFEGVGTILEPLGNGVFRVTRVVKGREMSPVLSRTPWWFAYTPEQARKVLEWMATVQ